MKRILSSVFALGLLAGTVAPAIAADAKPAKSGALPLAAPQRAEQLVGAASRRAVEALQKNDMAAIARLMHPRGLRVAPYAHLSARDIILSRKSVAALPRSRRVYNWGEADGTGDAIRLTWNAFRLRYLTPPGRDFQKGEMNFNTFKARGNTLNNLRKNYPGALFVECFVPGSDKYNFMDWRGLWLVWQRDGKEWRLRAVAGDQWTI